MRVLVGLLPLLAVLWAAPPAVQARIEARCTACKSIAAELERRIDKSNEKPRNHVDLRHRLDSTGKRYGKVIEYKFSELRAVELLDDLCSEMRSYSLVTFNDTASGKKYRHWAKVKGEGAQMVPPGSRPPSHIETVKVKQLEVYCGNIMEDHEEELTSALMKGLFEEQGSVHEFLCRQATKLCPAPASDTPSDHAEALPEDDNQGDPADPNGPDEEPAAAAQPAEAGAAAPAKEEL